MGKFDERGCSHGDLLSAHAGRAPQRFVTHRPR